MPGPDDRRGLHVLLVAHDAGGTVAPLVAIGEELVRRGHQATVLSQPSVRSRVEAVGCTFVPFSHLGDYARDVALEHQLDLTVAALAGPEVGHDLVATAGTVGADLVVVDANLAGALAAAESLPQPSAVLLHSMYRTFVDLWFGQVWPLISGMVDATRARFGLDPVDGWPAAFARHDLQLSVVPRSFDAPVPDPPSSLVHPGFLVPRTVGEPAAGVFPTGDDPAVLVSLSTTYQEQEPVLQRIVDALAGMEVRGLVTTSGHDGPSPLRVPPNVAVAAFVPHQSVLPHTDAVVSHAGLGTVAASLAAGVPLVCTPIARDQHLNTERVEALGVGIGCPRAAPAAVASALGRVLGEPGFRVRARALAAESGAAGGAGAVVDALVGLVPGSR